MKTLLLNSKKCLIANAFALAVLAIIPLTARADIPSRTTLEIEIKNHASNSFQDLLTQWQRQYGTHAINPLFVIAGSTDSDRTRYIAIMGAAKLGGPAIAPRIVPFLNDHSWMLRSAALKSLGALKNPKTYSAVLPMLKDPALVVRVDAIETVSILKPPGSVPALLDVLHRQENYHFGKSIWAPAHALKALAVMGDRSIVAELKPLLDHQIDPPLQREAIATLEVLTGHTEKGNLELTKQVNAWKQYLVSYKAEDKISTSNAAPVRH